MVISPILVLIFLLSGCTTGQQQQSGVTGPGVTIQDFVVDTSSTLEPGDYISLSLSIKNTGDSKARGVYAELINYGDLEFTGSNSYKVKLSSDLESGDEDTITWDLKVPEDIQLSLTYKPYVRVCYIYSTTAYQDFAVVGNDYKEDLPSFSGSHSNGPVGISFEIRNGYNYFKVDDDGNKENAYVRIRLYNNYNGIIGDNIDENDMSYGRSGYIGEVYSILPEMNFEGNNIISQDAESISSYFDTVGVVDGKGIARKTGARLLQGREAYLKHTFDINGYTQKEGMLSGRVEANATYRYCIQSNQVNIPVEVFH